MKVNKTLSTKFTRNNIKDVYEVMFKATFFVQYTNYNLEPKTGGTRA